MEELEKIRLRRKKLGITQKILAEEAGVSQSLIAKLESGKLNPSYSVVVSINDALDRLGRKDAVKAFSIANKRIIFIKSSSSVAEAVKIMRKRSISQLPVVERGKVVGSISERSLITHEDYNKPGFHDKKVRDVMVEPFPIISKNSGIDTVSDMLKYSSAVLLSDKGKITGIITKTDLLKTI